MPKIPVIKAKDFYKYILKDLDIDINDFLEFIKNN
jgi:hypothetical protein